MQNDHPGGTTRWGTKTEELTNLFCGNLNYSVQQNGVTMGHVNSKWSGQKRSGF